METKLANALLVIGVLGVFLQTPNAQAADSLVDGKTLATVTLDEVVGRVAPGGVLIISEQHGNQTHYARQRETLQALANAGRCKVSVGLEFLSWPYQALNAQFLSGQISETDFLSAAKWPGDPFANYREQALFPRVTGGELVSINAPDVLAKAVARTGIAGLSTGQALQMPPNFHLGSAAYRERFDIVMAAHVPPSALDRYFEAQSVRDETMAWRIHDFLVVNPTHCLAIIVGDFHAAWGGGLPDSLRTRGVSNITVLSQFETAGLTATEVATELGPHLSYGPRADAVWASEAPSPALHEEISKVSRSCNGRASRICSNSRQNRRFDACSVDRLLQNAGSTSVGFETVKPRACTVMSMGGLLPMAETASKGHVWF